MDGKIDNKYISNAIDELTSLLGIKDSIPSETIVKPLRSGNIKECVEKIANYLGLPIAVNVSYSDRFESRALSETDSSGRGIGGITAQVSIPSYLPFYGTSGLQGFPISVKVSGNYKRHPLTFITIMAHELSHIVLHSLQYKEKDNEFYTDLTAMILGFCRVMSAGRKAVEIRENLSSTETTTTTYGYLSDEQFHFAFSRIEEILKQNINSLNEAKEKAFQKLTTYKQQFSSYKRELFKFTKFLAYLDTNQNKKIKKEDLAKIILFHQPGYTDKFTATVKSNEEIMKQAGDYYAGFLSYHQHYTQGRLDSLRVLHKNLDALVSGLRKESDLLNSDASVLRKYVGFFHKLKINRQATSRTSAK